MKINSTPEYSKAVEKLVAIEVKYAQKRSFIRGFFSGLLLAGIISLIGGIYIWLNSDKIVNKALNFVTPEFMEDLFKAIPDAYVSRNKEKVLNTFDDFTNAVADGRVSKREFKSIGREIVIALKDRKFTYQEIDRILEKMNLAVRN